MMIRPARDADLDPIARIYEEVLDQEDARPVSYTLWVLEEEGAVCGCVNLNGVQLPEYSQIPWSIPAAPEEVGVIHTLVIRPSLSGRGLARRLVNFCEEELRRQGKRTVRLDTYEGNLPANTMYPRLGYRFAGSGDFLFQDFLPEVLNCYEKAL